jgi:hypothetical protein
LRFGGISCGRNFSEAGDYLGMEDPCNLPGVRYVVAKRHTEPYFFVPFEGGQTVQDNLDF